MRQRKEANELNIEIKKELFNFDKEEFLEYTKWAINHLYDAVKNENRIKINCTKEVIQKLHQNSIKYRITKDMDHISIQYVELYDYSKNMHEIDVKVYLSIYFYDNVDNNIAYEADRDKYWNDVWVVTCRHSLNTKANNMGNCDNCGAVMEYNDKQEMFHCEYCDNMISADVFSRDWKIVEIEVIK